VGVVVVVVVRKLQISKKFIEYYDKNDISRNFSTLNILQKNGVVKRKNRILEDIAITLICKNDFLKSL